MKRTLNTSRKSGKRPTKEPIAGDDGPLARSNPIPLYYQLATKLKEEILSGALQPGARYYSDRDLIQQYGVSLLTVRQAMSELVNERILERRQGSGTFISSGAAKLRAKEQSKQDAILFTGWSPTALTGWEAMYFRDIFDGIQAESHARGMRIMFDDIEAATTAEIAGEARKRGIRGALALLGSDVEKRTAALAAAGLRVVAVNFSMVGVPSVLPDDFAGALLAVQHLISLGHRRLAHLNSGEKTNHWVDVRRAYSHALSEAGLSPGDNPILDGKTGGTIDVGYKLTAELWKRGPHPTAIFSGNDLMAIGALRYFREHNIAVPGGVSIIGFDNIEAAEICSPGLTTIAVDRKELGRNAVRLLLDEPDSKGTQTVGVRLVKRETTAPV